MKISYGWLKEFIDIKEPPENVADILTNLGFETTVSRAAYDFENIVVAKVLSKEPHPNAEKLSICRVTDGSAAYLVVCGAPNVAAGQTVPFARVGARAGGIVIKKTQIRGVDSEGMICSEKELGISENSEGIMVLDGSLEIGADFSSVYPSDYVFEVEPLPNRPDILSHLGIAMELSAKLNIPLKPPALFDEEIPQSDSLVKISDSRICGRYIAAMIDEVKICNSPEWLKNRLIICGLRPINNIVDITNYVMLETGHPLHAFDCEKLQGGKITVRNAIVGEKIKALDGNEYALADGDIVISDDKNPVAIAGIIGGENSSVSAATRKILLESAVFDAKSVFNTRKRLKISTDASYRFERGMSQKRAMIALKRTVELIKNLNAGKPVSINDTGDTSKNARIILFYDKIKKHTGLEIPYTRVKNILAGLSFEILKEDEKFLTLGAPYFRSDIASQEDVIEEIVRIYGYKNIKSEPSMPLGRRLKSPESLYLSNTRKIRSILSHSGFTEVVNYGMVSDYWLKYFDEKKCFVLANPVSPEMTIMRPSLFCELWQNFTANYKEGFNDQMLFEVGNVFYDGAEHYNLGLLVCGNIFGENWKKIDVKAGFFFLKGIIEKITAGSSLIPEFSKNSERISYMQSNYTITAENFSLGHAGAISSDLAHENDIGKAVWWAEINLSPILENPAGARQYVPYSTFPSSTRDFCLLVPEDLPWKTLRKTISAILSSEEKILQDAVLLDIYDGSGTAKLPAGSKSMTVRITLRHPSKTFTAVELNEIHKNLLKQLDEKLSVKLRA